MRYQIHMHPRVVVSLSLVYKGDVRRLFLVTTILKAKKDKKDSKDITRPRQINHALLSL
jgi:hypothetical protein